MYSTWRPMLLVIVLLAHASYVQPSSIKISETADKTKPHALTQVERRNKQAANPGNGNGSPNSGKEKPKGKYTKEEYEAENIDVDSELFDIIASMSVNGKPTKEASMIKQKGKFKIRQKETIIGKEQPGKGKGKGKNNRQKRNFVKDTIWYWSGGVIPFTVNRTFYDDAAVLNIQRVLDEFQNKTCITFVNKTLEEIKTEKIDYFVVVTGNPKGCSSQVGRQLALKGIGNYLNLQISCTDYATLIGEEFGHTIGMIHEQSRLDRDSHVTVLFDNIQRPYRSFYGIGTTDDRNPYDYYSMMHYSRYEFNNKYDWGPTMDYRDPELEFLQSGAPGLSFYDAMNIASAYNCSAKCTQPKGYCKNGGFLGRNCTCFCPEGLTGPDCNSILKVTRSCGGIIDLEPGKNQTITSIAYPNLYWLNTKCYWLLRAQNPSQRVMIEIEHFDIAASPTRCYDWLEIRYNLLGQPGKKHCGKQILRKKISSTEFGTPHLMMLIFITSIERHWPGTGFKITATAIDASTSTDCGAPPVVPNSSNNYAKMGSKRGAIVRYKCDNDYGFGGIGSSVTCEADGTWSEVQFNCTLRDKIFGCDFKNGLCNIKLENNGTHAWTVNTKDGGSFLTVLPATIPTSKTFATIILPAEVYNNQSYCLSFKFQRTSNNTACAKFGWGNTFNKMLWRYDECESKNAEVITGTFKMKEQVTKVTFTSIAEGTEFNGRIDFISLYKGAC